MKEKKRERKLIMGWKKRKRALKVKNEDQVEGRRRSK